MGDQDTRVFHRSKSGRAALESPLCRLPGNYRRLLAAVGEAAPLPAIAAEMTDFPAQQLSDWLDDLEAIGLVESVTLQWLDELAALGAYAPQALCRQG